MNAGDRLKDQEFVAHLRDIAKKYDSDFLKRVANRFNELSEEKYDERFKKYNYVNSKR